MIEFIWKHCLKALTVGILIFYHFLIQNHFDKIDDKFYRLQHDIDVVRTVLIVRDIMPIEVHSLMRPNYEEE